MKNIVRALVVVLALTGAAASTHLSAATSESKVNVSRLSAIPKPMCPPSDPNGCGMLR